MLLELKNLSFTYNGAQTAALDNISFSVQEGEFLLLGGVSGCGKTTLLRLIKKELSPAGRLIGNIIYDNLPLPELDERRSVAEIGYVPQNPDSGIITDKVYRELAFTLESLGCKSDEIRLRIAEISGFFGITDWFGKDTDSLSGGQKQLLNLASAVISRPRLLLLDEPTAQLDPVAAEGFLSAIKRVNDELGITVLLVEHRLEETLPICDSVAVMESGRLIFHGKPRETAKALFESNHPLSQALPSALRIYCSLEKGDTPPFTVKEGKNYIEKNYAPCAPEFPEEIKKPQTEEVFSLKECYFRYEREGRDILRALDLKVSKGDFLCILGGNGAGKTTLLRVLSGIGRVYRGKLRIFDKKVKSFGSELYRGGISMLPQNPVVLFVKLTLHEDLEQSACLTIPTKSERASLIAKTAQRLGITHLLDRNPRDLSGGELQRAALCKLLLLSPKVILLDEPTKGLDAAAKKEIADILTSLNNEGVTIVLVTHDVEFAAHHAKSCAMFFDGQICSLMPPREFFSNNSYYTTAAARIAGKTFSGAISCKDVIDVARTQKTNGEKSK